MRWPWRQPEIRQSYTSQILGLQFAAATGGGSVADAAASTAIERAIVLYASAFSVATIEAPDFVRHAVTSTWRASMIRDLIRHGEHLSVIGVTDGRLSLLPAAAWEVVGGPDQATWLYKVELAGPNSTTRTIIPATGVVHLMWSSARTAPHRGRGPLTNCGLSARILGGLDRRLGDRATQPTGGFLPVPKHDVDPADGTSPNDKLGSDLAAAGGRLLIVTTTSGGDGDRASAPARDFNPTSFGLDIPEGAVSLFEHVEMKIFSATGIPPGLGGMISSSQAVSSLYRQWIYSVVSGRAAQVAAELEVKLEASPIAFSFDRMGHRPLVERATAIGRLVKMGGLSVADAKTELGL